MDCPTIAGKGPIGVEATGQWDRSRKKLGRGAPTHSLMQHFCPAPPPRSQGPAPAPSGRGEVAPAQRTPPRSLAASFSTAARTAPGLEPGSEAREPRAWEGGAGRAAEGRRRRAGGARSPAAHSGGSAHPEPDAAEPEDRWRRREPGGWWLRAEAAAERCLSAGATSRPRTRTWTPSSASSRAKVSVRVKVGADLNSWFRGRSGGTPLLTSNGAEWGDIDAECKILRFIVP